MTFEEKLAKLTEIVDKLEAGNELPLEDSLKLFEEGVGLVSSCREMLENAEQRVENVLKTDNS
ncbi:exodeoxyribonuclease VII small subunit [Candidatus Poribacteria bacterium]|nr:exodeoxyribonuclease VII small subunit [Candidatus Poribacteria bacterium]MDE0683948.1 exodeoxyribonuclease VII small subunit [Candidatus Poribacteria bacterium]MXV74532.1 exodeoxyribonuclease VII small subunit [Candidatus Poribacteria bacterium]